ncbi:glutathione S-transferase 1 [Octopus vulgaris]|uniref:Glutathione S-transferase 1 n=2 Tax=Octopus TaxID=6643 RepID=A0AA36AWQ5_OCTVU|nr:S-crystallin SL11 [Octopus sinensis]CAI9723459.1 glutathione S-transferase 1 [Octopus vulgaris]
MPTYKLTYFNGKGRAELTRLLFTAADVEFTDHRIDYYTDWPEIKPHTPNNQLPVLEIDDKHQIPQSLSIARYIAREYGLAGNGNLNQAYADSIVETFDDLHVEFGKTLNEKDEKKKAELTLRFRKETLPRYLGNLEKALKRNNEGTGYFVGDSLTWADLQAFHILDITLGDDDEILKQYPKLEGLRQRIENLPRISIYLQTRPQSKV